jgi:hypothetical protein
MAWPRKVHFGDVSLNRPRAHPLFPVFEISIDHLQRYRPAEQTTVTDSSRDLGGVGFNLHPAAAPVAELPTCEICVERSAIDLKSCWEAFDDAGEAGAVRLSGGC